MDIKRVVKTKNNFKFSYPLYTGGDCEFKI